MSYLIARWTGWKWSLDANIHPWQLDWWRRPAHGQTVFLSPVTPASVSTVAWNEGGQWGLFCTAELHTCSALREVLAYGGHIWLTGANVWRALFLPFTRSLPSLPERVKAKWKRCIREHVCQCSCFPPYFMTMRLTETPGPTHALNSGEPEGPPKPARFRGRVWEV